jgi:hypothetical protein
MAVGLAGAVVLALTPNIWWRLLTLAAGATTIVWLGSQMHAGVPYLAAVPWLVVGGWYVLFRALSYRDLIHTVDNLVVTITLTAARLLRRIVGGRTWHGAAFEPGLEDWARRRFDK